MIFFLLYVLNMNMSVTLRTAQMISSSSLRGVYDVHVEKLRVAEALEEQARQQAEQADADALLESKLVVAQSLVLRLTAECEDMKRRTAHEFRRQRRRVQIAPDEPSTVAGFDEE